MGSDKLDIRKASAGSGKTYTLALRFIELLIGHCKATGKTATETWNWEQCSGSERNRHSHILAVTFTNKATDEMKRRIVRELALLAKVPLMQSAKDSPYRQTLCNEFNLTDEQLTKIAQKALSDLLYNFGSFNVSTIDSFFQSVLRTFAYETDLSGNYDLQLNDRVIISLAVDEVIRQSRTNHQIEVWLKEWMASCISEHKAFNLINTNSPLRTELTEFIDDLTGEDFVSRNIQGQSLQDVIDLLKTLQQISDRTKDYIKIVVGDDTQFLASIFENKAPLKTGMKKYATDASFEKNVLVYLSIQKVLSQTYNYGLIGSVLEVSKQIKTSNNMILLSDTNTLLRKIIDDNSTPFVYERLGLRLRHFLIDEFQDTSQMQWENFRPLLEESLSNNNENLIIGDVKQCIYRFRNSNPELLNSDVENELNQYVHLSPMDTNYRSANEIVEFNNALFAKWVTGLSPTIQNVYQDVVQKAQKSNLKGYVKLHWTYPRAGENNAIEMMLDDIDGQLQRGYKQSDILILVRTNDQASDVIAEAQQLQHDGKARHDIKFISDESLLIKESDTVNSIISTLRLMVKLPTADVTTNYDYYSIADVYRISENLSDKCKRNPDADDQQRFDFLQEAIDEVQRQSDDVISQNRVSLFTLVQRLAKDVADDTSGMNDVFISALLDMVLEYLQFNPDDIASFLEYWDKSCEKAAIKSAPSIEAVRVMTIHKSKGLEAPCVHIPLMKGGMCQEDSVAWYSTSELKKALSQLGYRADDLPDYMPIKSTSALDNTYFAQEYTDRCDKSTLDELNAIYVAFTRAERELCITLHVPNTNAKNIYSVTEKSKARKIAEALGKRQELSNKSQRLEDVIFGEPTRPEEKENSVKPDEPIPDNLRLDFSEDNAELFDKLTVADEDLSVL